MTFRSDNQDGLRCWGNEILILRIQVCDPGLKDLLVVTFHYDVPGQVGYLIVSITFFLTYSFVIT